MTVQANVHPMWLATPVVDDRLVEQARHDAYLTLNQICARLPAVQVAPIAFETLNVDAARARIASFDATFDNGFEEFVRAHPYALVVFATVDIVRSGWG